MHPPRSGSQRRSRSARAALAALLGVASLAARDSAAAALEQRSFLQFQIPPVNWVPPSGGTEQVSVVVAREDGLVFVGGWNAHKVYVVDARTATAPRLVCELATDTIVDGLALDGNVLWIAGSDTDPDFDGLQRTTLPANPFLTCPSAPVAVNGVEAGLTPNVFDAGGRRCVLISNRAGFPLRIVDASTLAVIGSWSPSAAGVQVADASVTVTSSGQVLAAVAAVHAGAYVLDVTDPTSPVVLAHFDWTFEPPDFDGNPLTVDGCDRNGDGDTLECGESGRAGDGRRFNFCTRATIVEVDGVPFLLTLDGSLAGHVRVWSLEDVLASCPGESSCTTDLGRPSGPADGPPWPVVDVVPLVAWYQVDECPLAVENFDLAGETLFLAYYESGAHVVDLAAQGLPASGGAPFEMTAEGSFDTLPANSDTVVENYPCHPVATADTCESSNTDWQPSPCDIPPQPGAAFRVVRNAGLRSATDVDWAGCRLYVSDQGTPDGDGTTTHVGRPQGLWVLAFTATGMPEVAPDSLAVSRVRADRSALALDWAPSDLAATYRVLRGTLPAGGMRAYDHACVTEVVAPTATLAGQVTTNPAAPLPNYYYLVGCACEASRSALGTSSEGLDRPQGAAGACP